MLLNNFLFLAFLVVLFELSNLVVLLPHDIDHEGLPVLVRISFIFWPKYTHHCVILKAMSPRNLHDNVDLNEVIAGIEHSNVAFPASNVDELVVG